MVYRKLSPNLGQGFNLTAEFDSDYRRYSAFEQMITDYAGGVAADFPVGRKVRVAVHQTAEYGSVFRVGLLPASAVGGDMFSDYALGDRKRTAYYTSGQATYTLTRTSAIVANGLFRDTDSDGYDLDRRIRGGGISYQHLINRNFNLVLGYLYQQSDYGNPLLGQRTTINTFDLGGNYLWPLGASRRTTLSFGGGTGKVSQEVAARLDRRFLPVLWQRHAAPSDGADMDVERRLRSGAAVLGSAPGTVLRRQPEDRSGWSDFSAA